MNIEMQPKFFLGCDFWSRKTMEDLDLGRVPMVQGTLKMPLVPLSLLCKLFGTVPGCPWFNKGVEFNKQVSRHLPGVPEHRFDHGKFKYRLNFYGDCYQSLRRKDFIVWFDWVWREFN